MTPESVRVGMTIATRYHGQEIRLQVRPVDGMRQRNGQPVLAFVTCDGDAFLSPYQAMQFLNGRGRGWADWEALDIDAPDVVPAVDRLALLLTSGRPALVPVS